MPRPRRSGREDLPESAKWIEVVLQSVADAYGVHLWQLCRMKSGTRVIRPRYIAMRIMRLKTGMSFPEIASIFGASHSLAIHAMHGPLQDNERELMDSIPEPPIDLVLTPEAIQSRRAMAKFVEAEAMLCPECFEEQPRRVDSYGAYRCRECGSRWYAQVDTGRSVVRQS